MNGPSESSMPAMPFGKRVLRTLKNLGWISLFLVVLAIASTGPLVFIGLYAGAEWYWEWHTGHSFECNMDTIAEAVSPSKRWIARTRRSFCGSIASTDSVEAVLVPNDTVSLFSHYRTVFYREIENRKILPKGSDIAVPVWVDDHSLVLRTPACAPSCRASDGQPRPCDDYCTITAETDGIAISIKP